MAQQDDAAPTHGGTLDDASSALDDFNWDTGELEVNDEQGDEAPLEEVTSEVEEEVVEVEEEATEDEVELAEAEPEVVIDAPISWSDEQKETFATLPPEAQNVIVARESERDKGFQQKATELAEQRKEYESAMTQMNYERQQYAQTLSDNLSEGLQEPDIDLLVADPARYREEKIAYDQMAQLRVQAKGQADHYAAQNAHQEQVNKEAFYAKRNAELVKELPAFMQDAQTRSNVLDYGKQAGYTDGELEMARTADILIINKAMQWDALQKGKPTAADSLKAIPKVVKPGAKRPGNPQTRATKANLKSHKANGNVQSAAALMEGYF
tara:strand:- start:30199 stop:31173 length:975 start_codon:yes stop_codon:yes gene_type:complete